MNKLIKVFLFFFFLINYDSLISQPSITWDRIYNRSNTMRDSFSGVCEADSGNLFVAGFSLIPAVGYKIWIVKINSHGDTIWTKTVGLTGRVARSVVSSGDGGCVLTGGTGEAFSMKLDRNGNIVWEKSYGRSGVQCREIKKTSDGGYIACGEVNLQDGYVFKIDSIGNLKWDKIYPTTYLKPLYDIVEGFNSGYLVCGYGVEIMGDTAKSIVLRIDSKGELIWEKKLQFSEQSAAYSLNKTNDEYIVAGAVGNTSITIGKVYFSKLDSNGNIKFLKIFQPTYDEYFTDMKLISSNRYLITMSRDSGSVFQGKAIITDQLGNIINQRIFPSNEYIFFNSTLALPNGDILFAGEADFLIPFADEVGYAVRTDSTLFYKTVGINNNNISISENFQLYQNYPNPFNPTTTITFEIRKKVNVKMILVDISGKEIKTLINEDRTTGIHKYSLNAHELNLSSGTYFVKLITSLGDSKIIKILLVK